MYAPIRATASQTVGNNSALPQGDAASFGRNLVANNMTAQGPNLAAINNGLVAMEASNPTFAADARTVVNANLTPVQQGELSRISQNSAANANEPGVDTQTLILDLTQMTLDITGMIEPTPISDGTNTVISLFRGEWGQAGLSALGMIPYLGDAAKLGKLGKWAKTISNAIDAAAGNPAVRKALEPAMQKIADALDKIPQSVLDKLPESARKQIDEMKAKLDNFMATGASKVDDAAALIAKRKQDAREFYALQGFPAHKIDSHLAGIDFSKPVEVVTLPKGTTVTQYQAPGQPQGTYYANPGTPAGQLGINPNSQSSGGVVPRDQSTYVVQEDVQVLRSTAASITDTWSVPGKPYVAEGGGIQYFTTSSNAFGKQ